MAIYIVNQGKTYKQERSGGLLWSPKLDISGHNNAGFLLMKKVMTGDYILHNMGGRIGAISIAKGVCYDSGQPYEIRQASSKNNWNDDGYRIDTEYYDFDKPLKNADIARWSKEHPHNGSCFNINGKLKLRYLCNVSHEDASYIIREALRVQNDRCVKSVLYDALSSLNLGEDEYDDTDKETIENIINKQAGNEKNYSGKLKKQQSMTTIPGTSKQRPKRDSHVAANALQNADYKCEYDGDDRTFMRKIGKPYTEPHHLIPISRYLDFPYSVDVEENIVSLCSHCHNLLHYGMLRDKEIILEKLFNDRIAGLKDSGLDITLNQLKEYYR